MSDKGGKLDGMERIRLMLAGGRVSGERSYAKEKKFYGDPAKAVRFDSEKGRTRGMETEIDDVEALLDLWADWMRKPEKMVEGYPTEACGGFVPSWCKDTEEAAAAADAETIARVNAAYDSLARIYKEAINRRYGLGARVWRFEKDATFEDAKIMIRVKFVQRGLL